MDRDCRHTFEKTKNRYSSYLVYLQVSKKSLCSSMGIETLDFANEKSQK